SNASGMDTMLYMIGTQDILRTFGFGGIIDFLLDALNDPEFVQLALSGFMDQVGQMGGQLGLDAASMDPATLRAGINIGLAQLKYTPEAVDFSVIAVPVAGSFGFLLGLLLFMAPNGWIWFFCILFGLAGVGACAYFYTTAINNLTMLDATGVNMVQSLSEVGISV
ncbi:MAG TPA: hypothetical protein PLZ51_26285, partial [Aggregatilineales bacterium]|nr:hypothetical protein [Aggregatilineales bacterium]